MSGEQSVIFSYLLIVSAHRLINQGVLLSHVTIWKWTRYSFSKWFWILSISLLYIPRKTWKQNISRKKNKKGLDSNYNRTFLGHQQPIHLLSQCSQVRHRPHTWWNPGQVWQMLPAPCQSQVGFNELWVVGAPLCRCQCCWDCEHHLWGLGIVSSMLWRAGHGIKPWRKSWPCLVCSWVSCALVQFSFRPQS